MLGTWDSEIACLIEDKNLIKSKMGGIDFKVGKFAHEFWLELFKEHFGLNDIQEILDPIWEDTWDRLYFRAGDNTKYYW